MRYTGSFQVAAPKSQVYAFLTDPRRVTTLFPDVSNVRIIDENNVFLKAKVGMSFIRGTLDVKLMLSEKIEPTHAKLTAHGTGLSSAVDLESSFDIEDAAGGGSVITWAADARIGGLMASVGSRLIDSAAGKYIKEIVDSLQKEISR